MGKIVGWCDKCSKYSLLLTHTEEGVLCPQCLERKLNGPQIRS